jgi:ATP-dependent DNA ligase
MEKAKCRTTEQLRGRTRPENKLPTWVATRLTQLVEQAPDGPDWLHEIKFDGCRMHARIDRGRVQCGHARLLIRSPVPRR